MVGTSRDLLTEQVHKLFCHVSRNNMQERSYTVEESFHFCSASTEGRREEERKERGGTKEKG